MSHECTECKGRLHDYQCSNQLSDELTGMVCKLCDSTMVWTDEVVEGKGEWQVKNKKVKNGRKSKNKKTRSHPRGIMKTGGGRDR